uniref:T4 RNA ligase 1-like N-terminal domain-containing protein n=1 Tax=viral metagenome TaxID=1070528 RepID=A0A6C0DIG3_9ZZZZ
MANCLYTNLGEIKGFNELLHDKDNSTSVLKLKKINYISENNQKYKIITYDKDVLNNDLISTYGICRSVIVNSENKVVGFAPPKSIMADNFIQSYPEKTQNIIAEEFVEGTMINVFFDHTIGLTGAWEISTRNTVGAVSNFFKSKHNKTFRTMFLEAANDNNLILENLNKMYSYSFVLQHPDNRIVVPFKKSQLYLIAVYYIDNSDPYNIKVYCNDLEKVKTAEWFDAKIKFPEIYTWGNYSELINKYASMNTSYEKVGFVLYNNETGERTKIRNPVYEEVRQLRGNQPKLQYHYLALRKEGKVGNFLKFYPENKKELSHFRDQIHLFTTTLYENYISCYIKKEKPLNEFSEQYKTHMFHIHQIYLTVLKEQKLYVTNKVVINYVNALDNKLLIHSINYNIKKCEDDVIASSNIV